MEKKIWFKLKQFSDIFVDKLRLISTRLLLRLTRHKKKIKQMLHDIITFNDSRVSYFKLVKLYHFSVVIMAFIVVFNIGTKVSRKLIKEDFRVSAKNQRKYRLRNSYQKNKAHDPTHHRNEIKSVYIKQ